MKKILAVFLMVIGLQASASGWYDLEFEAQDRYNDVHLAWYVVQDVPQACAMAGVLKGSRTQYNSKIVACAVQFSGGQTCVIYTAKKLSLAVLGHEIRHCFEGAWHP